MPSKDCNRILTGKKVEVDIGDANLGKMFLDTLKSRPDFIGQVDPTTGEETTYGEMAENSVRCALWLKKQGIKTSDVVLICCLNRLEAYIPILATFYNAATFAFGYKGLEIDIVTRIFKDVEPKFIFTDENGIKLYEEAAKNANLDVKIITFSKIPGYYYLNDILNEAELKEVNEFSSLAPLDPNDSCLLPKTSGSTNVCQVVDHSYKCFVEGLLVFGNKRKESENKVSLLYYPIYWTAAFRVMLLDIYNYVKRIIVHETSHDLDEIFQTIEKYKVTTVRFSLGNMYRLHKWKDINKYDKSSIKEICFTGVKLPIEILNFFMNMAENAHLEQTYGTTEIFFPMSQGIMNKIDPMSCGHLNHNTSMKIVDLKTGEALGPNQSGEICFKSPYLMKGYYKNPKETNKAIDSEGWYHTGDLGHYDENELTFIHGRIKDNTFFLNGEVVPLYKVLRFLTMYSDILHTVVLPEGKEADGTLRIVAFVVLLPGSELTGEELTDLIKKNCDIQLPISVRVIDSIPVTDNGKFKTGELLKLLQ